MAQWQELLKLDSALQSQVRQLYEGKLCREIRHYLCLPIESQDWDLAAEDENKARSCLEALLVFLDEQWNLTVQQNSILLGPDFQAMKNYLKNFEHHPLSLAVLISECLKEEKKILASASEGQACSSPTMEQKRRILDDKINHIRRQTSEVQQETKSLEGLYEKLDFIEKNWRSRVEQHPGFSQPQAVVEEECLQQASFITRTYQMVQQQIEKILNQTEEIVVTLSDVELPEWKHRQQMACIGSPVDTSLDYLEKWFSVVAEVLLQIRKQVQKLQDLIEKYNRANFSNLFGPMVEIETAALSLLERLLLNALVVEQQPVMTSQPQRPLIIKTRVSFAVKVRFLANLTEFIQKCSLKVTPMFDKDVAEAKTIKGFRQFELDSSDYKNMDVYTAGRGLEAEFGHMQLKEKKGNSKGAQESNASDRPASKRKRNQSAEDQNHLSVTEELHVIKFVLKFQHAGLDLSIETSSLPLVVISSTNQVPAAWASIMWFTILSSSEVKDLSLFLRPPSLTWEQLAQVLSWQFLAVGELGLNRDQLCELKDKFADGSGLVHWKDFSKLESSAWFWIDGILDLIQKYLVDLWRDGSIVGFVSRARTEALLKEKKTGTFLIRFSESNKDGAITFSWVEHVSNETSVYAVEPYIKKELSNNSLPDIIYNYTMRNTNRKPLLYLYPDIPIDTAFGRYYKDPAEATPKGGKNGYVAKKFIPVSNNPTPPPSPTREQEMDTDALYDMKVGLTSCEESPFPAIPQMTISSTVDHKQVIQELFPDLYITDQEMLPFQNNLVCP